MDDPFLPPADSSFVVEGYLSPSQIEIVRSKSNSPNLAQQKEVLSLIDGFVISNGRVDPKYLSLKETVEHCVRLMETSPLFPERIQQALPGMYGMAYYNLLYLVGAFTEEDIAKLQSQVSALMRGEKPKDPVGKA